MNLFISLCLFVLGTGFVIFGGNLFVDAAGWIARAFGIPPFIIGATVVSLATTMPEMLVSLMAARDGMADMAIGNAIGSVTANTALILALCFLLLPTAVSRKNSLIPGMLLTFSCTVLLFSTRNGSLAPWGPASLLCTCVLFLLFSTCRAKEQEGRTASVQPTRKELGKNILLFLLGAAGIVLGSEWIVDSGSAIAAALGVSERIIAVTLVAVGTSLPELVTALTAIAKKESGLSAGNIMGANILDLTLILPLCHLVSGETIPVSAVFGGLDLPLCLGATLIAVLPMVIFGRTFRLQGISLLALYLGYLWKLLSV